MGHYETVCEECYVVLSNPAYDKFDEIIAECKHENCPYKKDQDENDTE